MAVNHDVGAEVVRELCLLGSADDPRAGRLASLDSRTADPAGRGVDQECLARAQAGATVQSEPSGLVSDEE